MLHLLVLLECTLQVFLAILPYQPLLLTLVRLCREVVAGAVVKTALELSTTEAATPATFEHKAATQAPAPAIVSMSTTVVHAGTLLIVLVVMLHLADTNVYELAENEHDEGDEDDDAPGSSLLLSLFLLFVLSIQVAHRLATTSGSAFVNDA